MRLMWSTPTSTEMIWWVDTDKISNWKKKIQGGKYDRKKMDSIK